MHADIQHIECAHDGPIQGLTGHTKQRSSDEYFVLSYGRSRNKAKSAYMCVKGEGGWGGGGGRETPLLPGMRWGGGGGSAVGSNPANNSSRLRIYMHAVDKNFAC